MQLVRGEWVPVTVFSKPVPCYLLVTWKMSLVAIFSIRSTAKLDEASSLQKPRCCLYPKLRSMSTSRPPVSLCNQGNSSWYLNCSSLAAKARTCWQTGSKRFWREHSKVRQDSSQASTTASRLPKGAQGPDLAGGLASEHRCKPPSFLTDVWPTPTWIVLGQEIPQTPARNHLTRTMVPVFE